MLFGLHRNAPAQKEVAPTPQVPAADLFQPSLPEPGGLLVGKESEVV
jgi:hypothetical protein